MELKAVLGQYKLFTDQNTKDHIAWTIGDNREQGSHAQSVYPIQDTSRMWTASVKQKE